LRLFYIFKNENINFSDFNSVLTQNDVFSVKNIIFLLIFSIFNWFFEILKWKTLASFCNRINTKSAAIQSLSSLTLSLITPNRIGEYPAKAMYYEKENRKQILSLNLLHNTAQLSTTLFFGSSGILFLLFTDKILIQFPLLLKEKQYFFLEFDFLFPPINFIFYCCFLKLILVTLIQLQQLPQCILLRL